jgi:hypothetical protein
MSKARYLEFIQTTPSPRSSLPHLTPQTRTPYLDSPLLPHAPALPHLIPVQSLARESFTTATLLISQQRCAFPIFANNSSTWKWLLAKKSWKSHCGREEKQEAADREGENPLQLEEVRAREKLSYTGCYLVSAADSYSEAILNGWDGEYTHRMTTPTWRSP